MAPPLSGGFLREVYAPLPAGFVFPYFEHFSFFDHRGSFREAWAEPACSVCDRPTDVEPSEGNYHFVMDVYEFLAVYPFPIGTQVNSVTCTFTTYAQHHKWKQFFLDGSILATADQLLFMLYVGSRAACEHSPSILRDIVGRPDFTASTFDHGAPSSLEPVREKNYDFFLRNLPGVSPSHVVPESLRRPRASHPDREVQMLLRSAFTPSMAAAFVSVWGQLDPHSVPHAARAAFQAAPGYGEHRAAMICRYWAASSRFAPRVAGTHVDLESRERLLVAVPIGFNGVKVAALVPVGGGCFAIAYEPGVPLLEQMKAFTSHLPCDEQPQAVSVTRDAHSDIVFGLPCTFPITDFARDALGVEARSHLKAIWCTIDALAERQLGHAALALQRCRSFVEAVPWLDGRIGAYDGPRPVVAQRSGALYRAASGTPEASAEWLAFLESERLRHGVILAAYEAEDAGTGLLAPFIACVMTAYTVAGMLVPPPQGLPPVSADVVLLYPYPEPPAPLCTEYLARMPPQQRPEGFPESFLFSELVKSWGRRILYDALNMTAAHDFECVRLGWSDLPRHPFICLGPGCFRHFRFDGGGSVCLNQFIMIQGDDGRFRLLDFAAELDDHKNLAAIVGIMGFSTDKELLSFLIGGMRWKAPAPRHFRVGHNLFSLKSRALGVGDATAKLIDKNLFEARLVCVEGETISDSSPCPMYTSPQYSMGMGGADKTDKPDEKRPTGNVSEPHTPVRERNAPHGEPDGEWVVSFNDLTGRKQPKTGAAIDSPFPDREHKYRGRQIYHANAYIRALAHVNGTCPTVSRDDVRWMFFQLFTEPCEHWLQIQYLVIGWCTTCARFWVLCVCVGLGGVRQLRFYRVKPKVMNMGTRPSSKVAVRFSKELNVEWRERMADHVLHSGWLDRQSHALRALLADREARLGYDQAQPFWCCEWTDDFWDLACEPCLSAHGAFTRRRMAQQLNLWMSSKASCGTVGDYIGMRSVLTGGFGTVTPEKRARCVNDCVAAVGDRLTKDELHAHNSFIVHLVDVLNLDPAVTQGLWAPDRLPVPGFAVVALSADRCAEHMRKPFAVVRDRYADIVHYVSTRPAAAFVSGITDIPVQEQRVAGELQVAIFIRMGSDACASELVARVFGHALEFEWFLPLDLIDPRWLARHINILESVGAAVNVAVFGLTFSSFQLLQEGDNTTEGAMLLGVSKVPDQQYITRRHRQTEGYRLCSRRLWFEHSSGLGLGFDDAGSREHHGVLSNLAAAFGRRRVVVDVLRDVPGVRELVADILDNTSEYSPAPRKRRAGAPASASDLRGQLEVERGAGIRCPSGLGNAASFVLSPSPQPRRARDAQPVARPALSPTPTADPDRHVSASPVRCAALSALADRPEAPRALSPTPPRDRSDRDAARRARSPQPMNAAAARAAAAAAVADKLLDTGNPYMMGSKAPASTRALVVRAKCASTEAIPRGTAGADSWGFQWANRFCEAHDLPVMRPRVGSPNIDEDGESELMALMAFWIAPRMRPGAAKAAKGISKAQPASVMLAIHAYRRVLRDCGRYRADLGKAAAQLRGLVKSFLRDEGQDSMVTDHHIPFALDVLLRAVAALDAAAVPSLGDDLQFATAVIFKFSMVRAPRLDEWCEMFAGDTYYRRSNFEWVQGRTVVGDSQQAVAAGGPQPGWLLRARNVPSKTDRSGQKWMGRFMWYAYDPTNPLNFPTAWLAWDIARPCPPASRGVWPAFSPTGDHRPFKPALARSTLRSLLTYTAGPEAAARHAWHDHRATIASALKGAGKSDATVQAVVCWATAASVELYGQALPEELAAAAELGTTVDASRHAHVDVPHTCPESVAAELIACADGMAADAATRTTVAAGSLSRGASRSSKPSAKAAGAPSGGGSTRAAAASVTKPTARRGAKRKAPVETVYGPRPQAPKAPRKPPTPRAVARALPACTGAKGASTEPASPLSPPAAAVVVAHTPAAQVGAQRAPASARRSPRIASLAPRLRPYSG